MSRAALATDSACTLCGRVLHWRAWKVHRDHAANCYECDRPVGRATAAAIDATVHGITLAVAARRWAVSTQSAGYALRRLIARRTR